MSLTASSLVVTRYALSASEIFAQARITADLHEVEQALLERSVSRSAVITAASMHTIQAGGKRLRAGLVLLAARLGQYALERVMPAATTAEFIHTASLVHDDLVDQADQRRNRITIHSRWDSDVALMVGDYLFGRAAAEMARSSDPRVITFFTDTVQTIVEGELNPVTDVIPLEIALEQYLFKIGCKTASLFAAACQSGMALGGGSEADITALGHYGYDLGLVFQIVDDVLDFTGNEATLGKPAGNDLRQGTITLPLIYAVANSGSTLLQELINRPNLSHAAVAQAVAEVSRCGGVERAYADAAMYARRAIAHLDRFAPSPARQALTELAAFALEREK